MSARTGFNGAGTARSRKCLTEHSEDSDRQRKLQWGRDRAVPEIVHPAHGRNGAAAGFNGAGTARSRK